MATAHSAPRAVTVLGPVDAEALGAIVPSERVIFDLRSRQVPPSSLELASLRDAALTLPELADLRAFPMAVTANLCSPSLDVLADELTRLASAADGRPCTVVDVAACTASGRDPAGLVALSRRTGVTIIMGVGRSCEAVAAAAVAAATGAQATADEPTAAEVIAQQLVDELTAGVAVAGEGGVCAGLIGLIPATPHRSEHHATLLQAAALAQMRTGAPIWAALEPPPPTGEAAPAAAPAEAREAQVAREALETVRLVGAHGGAAARLVLGRAQLLLGAPDAARALLREGATLCFDGVGCSWAQADACGAGAEPWAEPPSDAALARAVAGLAAEGWGAQLLASCGVAQALQLRTYGGGGYGHVLQRWLPRLRALGLGAADEAALRGGNATRLLCWRLPAAPAARLVRWWECTACHRRFEEALNPAEALPADQRYYEKKQFRYCTMQCLANHRKANFVQPFAAPAPPG